MKAQTRETLKVDDASLPEVFEAWQLKPSRIFACAQTLQSHRLVVCICSKHI
jgi:hypothetical protein